MSSPSGRAPPFECARGRSGVRGKRIFIGVTAPPTTLSSAMTRTRQLFIQASGLILVGLAALYYVESFEPFFSFSDYRRHPGWNRVIIPDTFFYQQIGLSSEFSDWWSSGIKNSFGPSAIWWLGRNNYTLVMVLNLAMLSRIPFYFVRICESVGIEKKRARSVALVATFLPASLYHLFGGLKEVPTMLLLLGAIDARGRQKNAAACLWAGLLAIFRFQWLSILGLFGIAVMLKMRPRRVVQLVLVFGASFSQCKERRWHRRSCRNRTRRSPYPLRTSHDRSFTAEFSRTDPSIRRQRHVCCGRWTPIGPALRLSCYRVDHACTCHTTHCATG